MRAVPARNCESHSEGSFGLGEIIMYYRYAFDVSHILRRDHYEWISIDPATGISILNPSIHRNGRICYYSIFVSPLYNLSNLPKFVKITTWPRGNILRERNINQRTRARESNARCRKDQIPAREKRVSVIDALPLSAVRAERLTSSANYNANYVTWTVMREWTARNPRFPMRDHLSFASRLLWSRKKMCLHRFSMEKTSLVWYYIISSRINQKTFRRRLE